MYRLAVIIILSLSHLTYGQIQPSRASSGPVISTEDLIQLMRNTSVDINKPEICEEPQLCVPYHQCLDDGSFNVQGIGTFRPRFASDSSKTLTDGTQEYVITANNTILQRNGVEAKVCHYSQRCCGSNPTSVKPPIDPSPPIVTPPTTMTDIAPTIAPSVPTSPTPPTQPTPATPTGNRRIGCGYRNPDGIDFKITNTGKAQYGEFPWIVAVMWKNPPNDTHNLAGGGSIIHPNVILTAAHILRDATPDKIKVRAGEWDTQTVREIYPHQDRDVAQIIRHSSFHPLALENNYALLVVDEPFVFGINIQPICLPTSNLYFDDEPECYSAGWGVDDFMHSDRRVSIMKKVKLPGVQYEKCEQQLRSTALGFMFKLHYSFSCAGGMAGVDTCTGDGGSPLMCPVYNQKDRYFMAGIVSWGMGCGEANVPGVYANVPLARKWIDNIMELLGFDTESYNTS